MSTTAAAPTATTDEVHFDVMSLEALARRFDGLADLAVTDDWTRRYRADAKMIRQCIQAHEALADRYLQTHTDYVAHLGRCNRRLTAAGATHG